MCHYLSISTISGTFASESIFRNIALIVEFCPKLDNQRVSLFDYPHIMVVYQEHFGKYENKKIILPEEHNPNAEFLQYHAENLFVA